MAIIPFTIIKKLCFVHFEIICNFCLVCRAVVVVAAAAVVRHVLEFRLWMNEWICSQMGQRHLKENSHNKS